MQSKPDSTLSKVAVQKKKSAAPSGVSVQLRQAVSGHEGFEAQAAALAPGDGPNGSGAPVQAKGDASGDVHAAAAQGIASGGGALPHLGAIQQSFGKHDVSAVQAHTGPAAAQASKAMGAEAYATGNHVAFGGSPDLHTAAHEAAHVVQQRAGVSLSDGVGKSGDGYEQHADKVADAVVKGESAEGLLDSMAGGGGGGQATQRKSIQMKAIKGGPELADAQAKLNALGYDCGEPDGVWRWKTYLAVHAFQKEKKLTADGSIGPNTMAAIESAAGGAAAPQGATPAPAGDKGGAAPAADKGATPAPAADKGGAAADKDAAAKAPAKGADQGQAPAPNVPAAGDKAPSGGGKLSPEAFEAEKKKLDAVGRAALAGLPATSAADANKLPGNVGQGDAESGSALPDWFMQIQDRLVASSTWGEAEEKAQHAIRDYAMLVAKQAAGPDGKVPDHIAAFFEYIGRGTKNDTAARKGGYKGSSDLNGASGAKNWCAGAATQAQRIGLQNGRQALLDELKSRGLEPATMPTLFFSNLANLSGSSKTKMFYGGDAYAEPLMPGDRVDYLFDGCQYGGHAVHIVAELGDSFLHVSGNTTRHSAVGTGQAKRLKEKPEKLNLTTATSIQSDEAKKKATEHIKGVSFGGAKLIYMIQRYGDPFKALSMLETQEPAALEAAMKKLLLKRTAAVAATEQGAKGQAAAPK